MDSCAPCTCGRGASIPGLPTDVLVGSHDACRGAWSYVDADDIGENRHALALVEAPLHAPSRP